jgi:hypothetical protein
VPGYSCGRALEKKKKKKKKEEEEEHITQVKKNSSAFIWIMRETIFVNNGPRHF